MERRQLPTYEEVAKGMEEYLLKLKNMSKEEAEEESMKALIEIGVLTPDGEPKEQICTGGSYRG